MHFYSHRKKLLFTTIPFFAIVLICLLAIRPNASSGPTVRVASYYDSLYKGNSVQTNCVYLARKFVELPYGLTYFEGKKNLINSNTPSEGYVAIVKTNNRYGHVSIVVNVNGSTITTLDGNWTVSGRSGRHIVYRTGTASQLGIVGYYVPKYIKQSIQKPNGSTIKSIGSKKTETVKTPTTITKKTSVEATTSLSTPSRASIKLATSRNYSTSKGVAVYSTITKNKTDRVTKAYLYLWKQGSKKTSVPLDQDSFSKGFTNQTSVSVYYRPGIANNKRLASKTTYNYQITAVVNGKTISTPIGTIRTK
ncbi:hypothetical protein P261_01267 [Lachnospiraceae bacterium TWA4]|nr:hypothetical protein P261_01267 [Lachnospiraceae bacterium TWA4]